MEEAAEKSHGAGSVSSVGNIFKTIIEGFNANSTNNPYRRPAGHQNLGSGRTSMQPDGIIGSGAFDSSLHPDQTEHAYSGPNLLTTPLKSKRLQSKQQNQR